MGFSHRESRVAPTSLILLPPKENKSRQIRQFHFHGWPEVGIPSDGKGMISIIAAVQKQQQQSGNHPITVHCSAGAGRTGTFCALSTVLERVKAEGILDVFQTVKSLRLQRPHMVQTLVCCPAYLSMPPHTIHSSSLPEPAQRGAVLRGLSGRQKAV